jgi:hypothetical protein
MSAPLIVNTKDGACWTRRTVTEGGVALYAPAGACDCPPFRMATLDELAAHGIAGSADALPMPVGPEPEVFQEDGVYRRGTAARVHLTQYGERTKTWSTATYNSGAERALYEIALTLAAEADGLRGRVAQLEAERHTTNEALSDVTVALREREAAPLTIFRAEHDSIVMGLYTTAAAARAHCEAEERRSWLTGTTLAFDWIEDEEDGVAELTVVAGQNEESVTGYVVTALEVSASYDEEADQ